MRAMVMRAIETGHGQLRLPAFMPDATRAVVRGVSADDLIAVGVDALMVNALHLAGTPGISLVAAAGGVHRFMGWTGPIASDSGGFQALSLQPVVTDAGIAVQLPGRARSQLLTPEKSIRAQLRLGSDILFCLDQCTHPQQPPTAQRESVARTVAWARRCRTALDRELETKPRDVRPLLFAVVQGGADRELRRVCIEQLLEIGFDGYGFGGWPVDESGALLDMVAYVGELLPRESLKHGLGIGKPQTLVEAWRAGYQLFDCVIPTRDGRHGRLYRFREDPRTGELHGRADFEEVAITNTRFTRCMTPLEPDCPCPLCRRYPAAYLQHLFRIRDAAGPRLATLHNLAFYARLIGALRERAQ